MNGWFITGTDTGVGKTRAAQALLVALAQAGHAAVGMKPIASGAGSTPAGLRHADAEALRAVSGVAADYDDINPYCFAPAVAPHLAAELAGIDIRPEKILEHFRRLQHRAAFVVVEGAGGWRVLLGPQLSMADLARALGLPVVLVVGMRLGCLSHALLTVEAIRRDGLPLAGWIANRIEPDLALFERNVAALETRIGQPPLAVFPHQSTGAVMTWPGAFSLEKMINITSPAHGAPAGSNPEINARLHE
ncbi:MAG: dethiobiotin synthase [Pseudomonadota bacterium]